MKKILYFLLTTCPIFSMQLDLINPESKITTLQKTVLNYIPLNLANSKKLLFKGSSVFIPQKLGQINLYHESNGFNIHKDSQSFPIQPCFMDKELRNISKESLIRLIAAGSYLSVNDIGNNEYSLKLHSRLNGGGVFGGAVGFFSGRFIVHFVAHGTIGIISLCTGPAAFATGAALEACLWPYIVATAESTALAGGILGAVITGPV